MTNLDWAALILFGICWLGYGPLLAIIAPRIGSLHDDMRVVRQAWMRAMTGREMRLIDSQLMGHSINSASFFASANLLLIAAVAGVLFGGEAALRSVAQVGGAETTNLPDLEAKLALILACLSRGLLDFIWSIRQMNYSLAVIGAAPEEATEAEREQYATAGAGVLNPALNAFSQGVRGYYFSLAAAAWLFGPLWLAAGVVAAFSLLIYRQVRSPAARAMRDIRHQIES